MKYIYALIICVTTAFVLVQGSELGSDHYIEDKDAFVSLQDVKDHICEENQVYKVEYYNKTYDLKNKKNTGFKCFCSGDFNRDVEMRRYPMNTSLLIKSYKCGSRRNPKVKSLCKQEGETCGMKIIKRYGYDNPDSYLDSFIKLCSCSASPSRPFKRCRESEKNLNTEIFRCEIPECKLDDICYVARYKHRFFVSSIFHIPPAVRHPTSRQNVAYCRCKGICRANGAFYNYKTDDGQVEMHSEYKCEAN